MKKQNNKLSKFIKALIIILPCSIYFSYSPLIYLGQTSLMNLELSIPLIFLVIFNICSLVYIVVNRRNLPVFPFRQFLVFSSLPFYATISILWSTSKLHGLLASGILWLICFIVTEMTWLYKDFFKEEKFKEKLLKIFLYFSIIICVFCWIQSILDLAGVSKEATFMCTGCVYKSFGFPHPNGFMAEPQYLGGILLAPTLFSLFLFVKKRSWKLFLSSFVLSSTLFLTLSRGAIYSFSIATLLMIILFIVKQKNTKSFMLFLIIVISFLFTLNMQGLFAHFSKTNDTYLSGISKVISQLSLGKINIPYKNDNTRLDIKYNSGNDEIINDNDVTETSYQDGYVQQSTNGRLTLSIASFELWRSKINYSIFGVGIGSAGAAIYHDFVNPNSLHRDDIKKMIIDAGVDDPSLNVQSEYAEILVEFGIIGIILVIIIAVSMAKTIYNNPAKIFLFSLGLSYLIASFFCSGITNSLYIYLFVPFFNVTLGYGKQNAK